MSALGDLDWDSPALRAAAALEAYLLKHKPKQRWRVKCRGGFLCRCYEPKAPYKHRVTYQSDPGY